MNEADVWWPKIDGDGVPVGAFQVALSKLDLECGDVIVLKYPATLSCAGVEESVIREAKGDMWESFRFILIRDDISIQKLPSLKKGDTVVFYCESWDERNIEALMRGLERSGVVPDGVFALWVRKGISLDIVDEQTMRRAGWERIKE